MGAIDWAAVEAEELERQRKGPKEVTTSAGIVVPLYTSGGHLRTWIKLEADAPKILFETPAVAMARWMAFITTPEQPFVVFHDHSYGQAEFYFRAAIPKLAYFGITYPQTEQGRTTPGSIWSGDCDCWRYGGPCIPKAE